MITVTPAKKIPHESERHRDSSCLSRDCGGARPKSRDERFHQRFPEQRGIVIPFVAIAMLALLAMAGLALDMGHLYENKTRLQNVVDAAALAAAQKLGETPGAQATKEAAATTAAEDTIVVHNKGKPGNAELGSIQTSDVTVTFFNLVPGVCAGVGFDPCFVRVVVNNLSRPNFFAQVLTAIGATKTVAARAVSGPVAVNPCDVVPMMVCAQDGDLDDAEDDGLFYGFDTDKPYCLKRGSDPADCPGEVLGNGNFQLIDLEDSQGGSDVCVNMTGAYDRCLFDDGEDFIDLKPGNDVAVADGLNTRFNDYPPGQNCQGVLNPATAPPDEVVSHGPGALGENYTSWKATAVNELAGTPNAAYAEKGRRVVSVPIGNCPVPCNGNSCEAPLLDAACFFLLQPVKKTGNDPDKHMVVGEFTGERCFSKGRPNNNDLNGPYKMVLYKDDTSGDS